MKINNCFLTRFHDIYEAIQKYTPNYGGKRGKWVNRTWHKIGRVYHGRPVKGLPWFAQHVQGLGWLVGINPDTMVVCI